MQGPSLLPAVTSTSPTFSQAIPGIDPDLIDILLACPELALSIRNSARDSHSRSYPACLRIERSLLTLARFTMARQHHQHTVRSAGPLPPEHPLHRVSTAQCSVLAVVEHLGPCAPVDIAAALTLHRSTVLRHLQALEAARLVHRDLGPAYYPFIRPLFVLTHEGRGAMRQMKRLRVRRLEKVTAEWSPGTANLVSACVELLAMRLHDELDTPMLPAEMGGIGGLPFRHRLWLHRGPREAERRRKAAQPR